MRYIVIALVAAIVQPLDPILKVVTVRAVEVDNAKLALDDLKAPDRVIDRLAQIPDGMDGVLLVDCNGHHAPVAIGSVHLRPEIGAEHCCIERAIIFLLELSPSEVLPEKRDILLLRFV